MDNTQWVEWLQALELAQVTITATIDPVGRLGPVGGLWPKLLAAATDVATLGLLRVVVVAEEQSDVAAELLAPDASPLRVLQAATLQEAVQRLYEEHGAREAVRRYEQEQCAILNILDKSLPIATHYQVLPLLQEVKRERLPRTEREGRQQQKQHEAHGGFCAVDILRWEEQVREETITYERVPLERVLSDFRAVAKAATTSVPRFVVLGPPGSGKTTLMQYVGWQVAQRAWSLSGRPLLPARIRLREWEAWAAKEGTQEESLPHYLTERYKTLSYAPNVVQWQRWLQKGEVLLLLDGVDEIEGKPLFLAALKTALASFIECPTLLTCRTVSVEQHRALCPDFPLFTLAPLASDQRDAFIRTFPTAHHDRYNPDTLITQLMRTPQLLPLAANPLLLNIICYVVDDVNGVIPTTRSELYTRALERLLTRPPQRVEVRYPGEEPTGTEKLAILARVALNLFAKNDRQLTFTGEELGQELKWALSEAGYGAAPAPWANALRVDLITNSAILRGNPTQGFFFLHLTIQEFLAAATLARIVAEKGWRAPVQIAGTTVNMRYLVDSKAWDPRWHEVLILLAGQLEDPLPLLTLLADDKKDDLFHCRLALATLCLPEMRLAASESHAASVDRLSTAVLTHWLQYERNSTEPVVTHMTRALPALGQLNGRREGITFLHWFCQQLRASSGEVRAGVAKALGRIGTVVAQYPEILSELEHILLHDVDELVRAQAAETFRRIGVAAAQHPQTLLALVQVALHDTDWFVRSGAVRALVQMGAAAQHPEVLSALEAALHDDNPHVRAHATDVLRLVEGVTLPQSSPAPGQRTSREQDEDGIYEATAAFKQAGATDAQHPELTLALVQALHDKDTGIRHTAIRALEQVQEVIPSHPEVLSSLVEVALHDADGGVRTEAAAALGRVEAAATQLVSVLLALVRLVLRDTDAGVRARAAQSLGQRGNKAAWQPEVLSALVQALRDADADVRFRSAEALAQMMAQGVRIFRRRWGKIEAKRVDELAALRE